MEEEVLKGAPISDGVAVGILVFSEVFQEQAEIIPDFPVPTKRVEKEISRYRKAITSSRKDLYDLQTFLAKEGSTEAVSIIDTHIQMLEDPFMTTFMEKKIRQQMKNTESVFRSVMTEYEKGFSKVNDSFFKERLLDVKDLTHRILSNLHSKKSSTCTVETQECVVFTKELIPSKIAEASSHIKGFISERGGATSHVALIARSKGMPYVANIDFELLKKSEGEIVIIDGTAGLVIISPTDQTLAQYKPKAKEFAQRSKTLMQKKEDARTLDGTKIEVLANIESIDDLSLLIPYGAEGIGLFRSEFLFFGQQLHSFSEEEQYCLYKQLMDQAKEMEVTFRVFDVGGDKGKVDFSEIEPNPALGCRGIRFLLKNREIFTAQLRALLRVSNQGRLNILLPFVTDVLEVIETKQLIQEIAIDLKSKGLQVAEEIQIGSMIEVPSAVITADLILKECDFLSIGTNDLIQYTLAADRSNKQEYPFYKATHPSIIRMLEMIVNKVKNQNKDLSLCGEMAASPFLIPLLLGLGIRKFSCSPRYIPSVKEMIKRVSLEEAVQIKDKVFTLESADQIQDFLQETYGPAIAAF